MCVEAGPVRVIAGPPVGGMRKGEESTLPRNGPHRHFNPARQPVHVHSEHRPARQSAGIEYGDSKNVIGFGGTTAVVLRLLEEME